MIAVRTSRGHVTSWRILEGGHETHVWRCDEGKPPHDFGTVEAAQEWIDAVWHGAPQKERDEAAWTIEPGAEDG